MSLRCSTCAAKPQRRDTAQVQQYAPEVLLLTPCGHNVGKTLAEVAQLAGHPGWWDLPAVKAGRVYIADSALFCRPGPRCVRLPCLLQSYKLKVVMLQA